MLNTKIMLLMISGNLWERKEKEGKIMKRKMRGEIKKNWGRTKTRENLGKYWTWFLNFSFSFCRNQTIEWRFLKFSLRFHLFFQVLNTPLILCNHKTNRIEIIHDLLVWSSHSKRWHKIIETMSPPLQRF